MTGGDGQVGRALGRRCAGPAHAALLLARSRLDIRDEAALRGHIADWGAEVVINCAAYTSVDRAESERTEAFAVNATGAGHVARACATTGVPLVHVSTDYVFDGAGTRPYREDDPLAPLGVYGASKAAGEAAVRAANPTALVVRTSWVFSRDQPSFVRTMVRLARDRPVLRVVDDQVGCPTFAEDLADALLALAERAVRGDALERVYHACNAGAVSWCALARALVAEARAHAPIACTDVVGITTAEYPTAAKRPAYSVLDTTRLRGLGIELPPWQPGLQTAVRALLQQGDS